MQAFAYAIKQTPYAFVAKIILRMYLLHGPGLQSLNDNALQDDTIFLFLCLDDDIAEVKLI